MEEFGNHTNLSSAHPPVLQIYCNTSVTMEEFGNHTNLSSTHPPAAPYIYRLSHRIVMIVTPIIIFSGLIGNVLSAFIFLQRRQRKTSCSLYIAARAVSDTGFLICLLPNWIDTFGYRTFHVVPVCQICLFLSYVCGFLSVWFVVFVTIENYIRVCRPFMVQRFCTTKRAGCVIATLSILAVALYNESLWINHVVVIPGRENVTWCTYDHRYMTLHAVLAYGDTVITLVIPSVFILALMGVITYRIIVSSPSATKSRSGANLQAKVTRMLFWVSFVFLLLNLPLHIMRIYLLIRALILNTDRVSYPVYFIQQKLQLLYWTSFAVNFILYVTLGDSFRRALIRMFLKTFTSVVPEYTTIQSKATQNLEMRLTTTRREDEESCLQNEHSPNEHSQLQTSDMRLMILRRDEEESFLQSEHSSNENWPPQTSSSIQ